jgi:hypothetical protein
MALPACSGGTTGGSDSGHDQDAYTSSSDAGNDASSDGGSDATLILRDSGLPDTGTGDSGADAGFVAMDAGGTLVACGGRTGHDCGADEYCDYPAGGAACGVTDGSGICRARPLSCDPSMTGVVCGCDGNPYPSECDAAQAGMDTGPLSCLHP